MTDVVPLGAAPLTRAVDPSQGAWTRVREAIRDVASRCAALTEHLEHMQAFEADPRVRELCERLEAGVYGLSMQNGQTGPEAVIPISEPFHE